MPETKLTVGDRVKKHRTEEGLSLRQLQEKIGVDGSSISNIERGLPMSAGAAIKIAKWLGCTTDELMP